MASVGDLIMELRTLGPDLPQVFPPPAMAGANFTPLTTGGALAAGTYYLMVTQLTPWGESLPSTEFPVVCVGGGGANSISVIVGNLTGGFNVVPTAYRVYISTVSGSQQSYQQFNNVSLLVPVIVTGSGLVIGAPPARSTAYLPDTDGGFVSAFTMYRWLNEALSAASSVTGGIQTISGIPSISGQRRYILNGQWQKITTAWYDGWELHQGNKAETFQNRNITAGISGSIYVDEQADTTRIELYWTPNRTAGLTTTSAPLLATDLNCSINAPPNWLLQDGLALVGSEIVHYSSQDGVHLNNLVRGYAGTQVPASLASGAAVSELNIVVAGNKTPPVYAVGDSTKTLGVPSRWMPTLAKYLTAKFREAEQERQDAAGLFKEFQAEMTEFAKSNKQIAGPRQCRVFDDPGIRGVIPGGLSGGIVMP